MDTELFKNGYEYVINDPEIIEKSLIGGGLSYLAFLLLPLFAIQGYLVQTNQTTTLLPPHLPTRPHQLP